MLSGWPDTRRGLNPELRIPHHPPTSTRRAGNRDHQLAGLFSVIAITSGTPETSPHRPHQRFPEPAGRSVYVDVLSQRVLVPVISSEATERVWTWLISGDEPERASSAARLALSSRRRARTSSRT